MPPPLRANSLAYSSFQLSLSADVTSPSTFLPLPCTGSIRDGVAVRPRQTAILINCPSELLLEIAHYVDDLRALASVSRALEDVASYVDFSRHKNDLPEISIGSPVVLFAKPRSNPPLWSWKRTGRIFLPCTMPYTATLYTPAQTKSLLGFLSTPFTTCPCSSIAVAVFDKGILSLNDIIQLFRYCDDIRCGEASIDIKDFATLQASHEDHSTFSPASVSSIGSLSKIDISIPHLSEREWSYLFDHLTLPNLKTLEIVGSPHPHDLVKFLSRHQKIACLRLDLQQRGAITSTEPLSVGLPELEEIRGPTGSVAALLGSLAQVADICKVDFECIRGTLYDIHASRIWKSLININSLIKLELHMYTDFKSRLMYFTPSSVLGNVLSLSISITILSWTEKLDDADVLVRALFLLCELLLTVGI